jgi:hypothetical protein
VSFAGAHNAKKETSAVGKRQVFAIGRDCGAKDGVILRVAGQAAFCEANRSGGAMAYMPAGANSGQQDRSDHKRKPPRAAGSMPYTILLLRSMKRLGCRQTFLQRLVDRSNESVSPARESFHKAGIFGGVAESVPKSFDCSVQAVVEIYKRVGGPKPGLQFLASDDLAGALEEEGQNLKWLVLESHP